MVTYGPPKKSCTPLVGDRAVPSIESEGVGRISSYPVCVKTEFAAIVRKMDLPEKLPVCWAILAFTRNALLDTIPPACRHPLAGNGEFGRRKALALHRWSRTTLYQQGVLT